MSYYENDVAKEIKRSVTMFDICSAYGIKVNAAGFAPCPFHREKTASMKIYPGQRGYYCFGCGRGGDVISFAQEYFDLDFKDAITRLNNDLCLGLRIYSDRLNCTEASDKIKKHQEESIRQKRILAKLKADYDAALDCYCLLDRLASKYAPKSPEDDLNEVFLFASHHLPDASYVLDRAEHRLYSFKDLYQSRK